MSDLAQPQEFVEEPAHPGSPFMILVCKGREPTLDERRQMAARAKAIASSEAAKFKWNMGGVVSGPAPTILAPGCTLPVGSGFGALEAAAAAQPSYGEVITVAIAAVTPPTGIKVEVLAGETPLQAARRLLQQRKE